MTIDNQLSKIQLTRKIQDAGYSDTVTKSQALQHQPMVSGRLEFDRLPSGLSIHSSDTTVATQGKATSELTPCISINLLMAGSVDFAIGQQRYRFEVAEHPILFTNIIDKNSLFTRFLNKGAKARKLNITVDKGWLVARCCNEQDMMDVQQVFSAQATHQLVCNDQMLNGAQSLFDIDHNNSLTAQFEAEQLAFKLFNEVYQQLKDIPQPQAPNAENTNNPDDRFERQLSQYLTMDLSLAQLAKKLGASISTLQRHFKAAHQCTLKEYIRNQRLENARRAILFENMSVGEAGYLAGYSHPSNFSNAFKKYFDMTPAQLQKRYVAV